MILLCSHFFLDEKVSKKSRTTKASARPIPFLKFLQMN